MGRRPRVPPWRQVNVTLSGRTCQRWDAQSPHEHHYTAARYPDAGLAENYCRSPGENLKPGETNLRNDMPWCLTTDPQQRIDTVSAAGFQPGEPCRSRK